MLPYVKKYVIVACVIAVVIPLVVSTVWPLFTGQIMAASVGGLILLLALFFGGFLVAVRVMGRKADELVDSYIALYDEKCDPQAFVDASRDIASSVVVPFTPSGAWFVGYYAQAMLDRYIALYDEKCDPQAFVDASRDIASSVVVPFTPSGAWFVGYYAQAMLDLGFVEKAEKLRDAMFDTIAKSKKASDQISTIVDLVPLMTKLKGPEETLPVVEKGIELIGAPAELDAAVQKDYLTGQAQILRARMNGELDKLAALYADVVSRECDVRHHREIQEGIGSDLDDRRPRSLDDEAQRA